MCSCGESNGMIKKLDELVYAHKDKKGAAIPILQSVQGEFGYIPKELIPRVSRLTDFPASELYSIITFYSQFRFEPVGANLIHVCHGTACHLAGAEEVTNALLREFGIEEGETSEDGLFTVESVACIGCCSLAPVMNLNGETYGRLSPAKAVEVAKENYQTTKS